MKANVLFAVGDLRYVDIDKPMLNNNEVLVNVKAAGICGSDVPRVFTTGTYQFPTIIGHEFAGEIVDTFSSKDEKLIGKRVSVFPLLPCMKCDNCKRGDYETCDHYSYLGSRCDGGFAEYVAVPKWNLNFLPDSINIEEAAMLEPASVAFHALKRSGFKMGDSIAIVGPGTIGMILAQLAYLAGAEKVFLIGRSQNKLDFAKNVGITEYLCNSVSDDVLQWINSNTDGKGVDVAVEGTGAEQSMDICINMVRTLGTVLVLGNPITDMNIKKNSYWNLLRKQLTLIGTWNSNFGTSKTDWLPVISLLQKERLKLNPLITHRFPLVDLIKGLEIMKTGSEYSNKIMIIND